MPEDLRATHLPRHLCETAEKLYGAEFGGLEALLTYLLQEITREDVVRMGDEERRIVEERLKNLGYV